MEHEVEEYGMEPEEWIEELLEAEDPHSPDYDSLGLPTEEDDEGEEEEEDEEGEEDDEVLEEEEIIEWEKEPYPDPSKEPWSLDRAHKHFVEMLMLEKLKDAGVDVNNKKAVSDALNHAWKETPREMRELEKECEEQAKKATENYKKKEYDPWHEQYENARIAEEFSETIEILPELNKWMREIQIIGPEFFKEHPKLAKSPARALPILLNIVKQLGHVGGERKSVKPTFSMEKGKRQVRIPKSSREENSGLFKKGIRDPGEWVASL